MEVYERGNLMRHEEKRGSYRLNKVRDILRVRRRVKEDIWATEEADTPTTHTNMSKKKYNFSDSEMTEDNGLTKEDRLLMEFRSRIVDLIRPEYDEHYLRKWLKARCFDVSKAEQMFRESMSFREKLKVDSLLDTYDPPKVLREYLTGGFPGYDKEGSPIRVELFGYLDMKGIMYSTRKIDLEKTKLVQCETTVRDWKTQSIKLGKRVDGLTVIFDMDNVGSKALWRPGLQMYLHLVKILEDNYPEMMKRMFVINAPRIFPLLWKICRPLISEDMKNKIHVLGGDYEKVLLEYIDADQLPKFLGGEKTDADGDPRCSTMINQGGEVPRSMYLSETTDTESMDSTVVGKGDKFKLEFTINRPGSILRWEFMTEEYDIAFGVFHKSGKKVVEVVPPRRVESYMVPEEGHVICEQEGTYDIVFDNTYSWTRPKKLYYVVELHMADSLTDAEVNQVSNGEHWTRLVTNTQITYL